MKPKFIIIILSILFLGSGCATSMQIKDRCVVYDPKTRSYTAADKKIPPPKDILRVGEMLKYEIRWMGMTAGEATLWVKEVVNYEGRQAYHVISTVESNNIISKIYKVRDEVHTYIDCENFSSLRFEKHIREGGYKCDEAMEYDPESGIAIYRKADKKLAMTIPKDTQDALSCLFLYRIQDIEIGKSAFMNVNTDEKNWKLEIKALERQTVKVSNQGTFNSFVVEPLAKFKGVFIRKGKMQIWFSADERRLPLVVKSHVPVMGSIVVVLTNLE